jgi:predicted DNA binding CopG/RHH family protein
LTANHPPSYDRAVKKKEEQAMRQLAIRVPEPLLVRVKIEAAKRRVSVQQLVTDLLVEHLKRSPGKKTEGE